RDDCGPGSWTDLVDLIVASLRGPSAFHMVTVREVRPPRLFENYLLTPWGGKRRLPQKANIWRKLIRSSPSSMTRQSHPSHTAPQRLNWTQPAASRSTGLSNRALS